jgi:hypothetical protein
MPTLRNKFTTISRSKFPPFSRQIKAGRRRNFWNSKACCILPDNFLQDRMGLKRIGQGMNEEIG